MLLFGNVTFEGDMIDDAKLTTEAVQVAPAAPSPTAAVFFIAAVSLTVVSLTVVSLAAL